MQTTATEYLVVGTGAVGMAFVDTLLTDDPEATVTMVDRYHKPGGHWTKAYPFVTLHQPSAFYGVSSRPLGSGHLEQTGLNAGLAHLATGAEVLAYFDAVMRERFIPSGRVRYHPLADYHGDGAFTSRLTGETRQVDHARFVDGTHLKTSIPATHTPSFEIDPDVRFMPLNDLVDLREPAPGYVVIGGGKTGIDACLWLLEAGVDPDDITWIVARDAWLLNRRNTQPGDAFFHDTIETQAAQFESIRDADSIEDLFVRLEACGYFLRLDPEVEPTMFRGATISVAERDELRRIRNVVRLGRVTHLHADRIVLEHGEMATTPRHVHVDCSATALPWDLEDKPVFDGATITPQMVRAYQPVFSASFVAHIEATVDDEAKKNELCGVVPLPNTNLDYLRLTRAGMINQYLWTLEPGLGGWLAENRLDGFSKLIQGIGDDEAKRAVMRRLRAAVVPALGKLEQFLADAG